MRCELYLYWRTSLADLPAASVAMQAFQRLQTQAEPRLQARLLRRAEVSGSAVTLMETYVLPVADGAIGDALRDRIVLGGDAASAPWREGPRHLETFSEIDLAERPIDSA